MRVLFVYSNSHLRVAYKIVDILANAGVKNVVHANHMSLENMNKEIKSADVVLADITQTINLNEWYSGIDSQVILCTGLSQIIDKPVIYICRSSSDLESHRLWPSALKPLTRVYQYYIRNSSRIPETQIYVEDKLIENIQQRLCMIDQSCRSRL